MIPSCAIIPAGFYSLVVGASNWTARSSLANITVKLFYSTSVKLTVKKALRLLYKRVHPDLFQNHPIEQAENERSLKLLQDYLHQARHGNPIFGGVRNSYDFVFFIKSSDEFPDQAASPEGSSRFPASLRRVSIVLPFPEYPVRPLNAGRYDNSAPSILPSSVLSELGRLTAACGLPSELEDEITQVEESQESVSKLLDFLPSAVEKLRRADIERPYDPAVRCANLRGAMRLVRGLIVSCTDPKLPMFEQVKVLEALAKALSTQETLDLRGLNLKIGQKTGVDSRGNLWLHQQEEPHAWLDFLSQVDLGFVRSRMETVKAAAQLEASVALAVGVLSVFTAQAEQLSEPYQALLLRLADHSWQNGKCADGKFADVPLMVKPHTKQNGGGASEDGGDSQGRTNGNAGSRQSDAEAQGRKAGVNVTEGYIWVRDDCSAEEVYQAVSDFGNEARQVLVQRKERDIEEEELTSQVRKRLQLRRLLRHESVTSQQYDTALRSLLRGSRKIVELATGLSVQISNETSVDTSNQIVNLAWNLEV